MPSELRVANEGVAHDDEHWYFSNQHFLYQTTVNPITIRQSNHDAIPEDLRVEGYNHIGDIDVLDGILYGGIENGPEGLLGQWNTSNLQLISTTATKMKGVPWVAVEPNSRVLYTAEWNECCKLNMYDIDNNLQFLGTYDMPSDLELPKEVQGGAFYENDLYLCINANDEVWKLELKTGSLTLELSDAYKKHDYEMEGITFWDLSNGNVVVGDSSSGGGSALDLGLLHIFGNFMSLREKSLRNYKPMSSSATSSASASASSSP